MCARRKIVGYCRGPYCVLAVKAVKLLPAKGFRAVRMEHGVPEWRAKGLPVIRPEGGRTVSTFTPAEATAARDAMRMVIAADRGRIVVNARNASAGPGSVILADGSKFPFDFSLLIPAFLGSPFVRGVDGLAACGKSRSVTVAAL